MAMEAPKVQNIVPQATLEQFKGIKHDTVAVGVTVEQVPSTNLSHRRAIVIQNKHTTATVFIGGGIPDLYLHRGSHMRDRSNVKNLKWNPSATTDAWYATTKAGGDPSLTETKYLYYRLRGAVPGTYTLATNAVSIAAITDYQWDWGDGDTLGYNTIYIGTTGSTDAHSPESLFDDIFGYTFTLTADDTATTGGVELGPLDSIELTLDGGVKVFAISDTASTPVGILEFI